MPPSTGHASAGIFTPIVKQLRKSRRPAGSQSGGQPVEVTVQRLPRMPKREFQRKTDSLKQLGEQGLLRKAPNPVKRDRDVTKEYRQDLIRRIHEQYGKRNPDLSKRLIERITKKMQPDHVHELQLGGPDTKDNLRMLDTYTNHQIGTRQIWPQIRNLPNDTPIRIRVIE